MRNLRPLYHSSRKLRLLLSLDSVKIICTNTARHFSSELDILKELNSKTLELRGLDKSLKISDEVSETKPVFHVPAFNVAAYVNESPSLQELVKLGVDLHRIQCTKGALDVILRLNFERDVKKYLRFLHDVGVAADDLGPFISRNPFIFKEDLENLAVRINYLESKKFTYENISRIITKNPSWLSFETIKIDDRLGFFQDKFELIGPEVRHLTVRMPKIITSNLWHIEGTHFSVKEEMGFNPEEIKSLILNKPKVFTVSRKHLTERFMFVHSEMGLEHAAVAASPGVLLCRLSKLRERHSFLSALGLAQYRPELPGYVAPLSLVAGSDAAFCSTVCHVSVDTYNKFLKTLT